MGTSQEWTSVDWQRKSSTTVTNKDYSKECWGDNITHNGSQLESIEYRSGIKRWQLQGVPGKTK